MELIKASIHTMQTKFGTEIEYARLTYRTARGIVGQSMLLGRLSPKTLSLARAGYRTAD
ncbi:hypothetical protein ACM1PE_06845 [Achromobacter sp. PD1]|uniref:hypothetical protein n=1 Tax=Achromobacter sp. PD1 TaxID=3399125 RepID=UPI003AF9C1CC